MLLPTVNSAHFTSTSSIWYLLDILVDSLQNIGKLIIKLLLAREGKVMSPGSSAMETPSQSFASPQVPIFGSIFHYCNNSTNISGSYPWWIILRPVAGSSPALRMSATGSWAMHRWSMSSIDRRHGKEESNHCNCIHETSTNEYTTLQKQHNPIFAIIRQAHSLSYSRVVDLSGAKLW